MKKETKRGGETRALFVTSKSEHKSGVAEGVMVLQPFFSSWSFNVTHNIISQCINCLMLLFFLWFDLNEKIDGTFMAKNYAHMTGLNSYYNSVDWGYKMKRWQRSRDIHDCPYSSAIFHFTFFRFPFPFFFLVERTNCFVILHYWMIKGRRIKGGKGDNSPPSMISLVNSCKEKRGKTKYFP